MADALKQKEAHMRHVHKKRALGLCGYVGCHEKTGNRYYCRDHTDYMSIRSRISYYITKGREVPPVKREYKKLD